MFKEIVRELFTTRDGKIVNTVSYPIIMALMVAIMVTDIHKERTGSAVLGGVFFGIYLGMLYRHVRGCFQAVRDRERQLILDTQIRPASSVQCQARCQFDVP